MRSNALMIDDDVLDVIEVKAKAPAPASVEPWEVTRQRIAREADESCRLSGSVDLEEFIEQYALKDNFA